MANHSARAGVPSHAVVYVGDKNEMWLRFDRTGRGPAVCTHAYACVLLKLARFGQVITDRVNVWFWNAALTTLNRLTRLRRFRALLRFHFLRHFRPSQSCLRWRLDATSRLGAYVFIAKAHQAITPRRPAAQSCRCARVYITHQPIQNYFRSAHSTSVSAHNPPFVTKVWGRNHSSVSIPGYSFTCASGICMARAD